MVSEIRACRNFKFISQKYSTSNASQFCKDRTSTKGSKRHRSACGFHGKSKDEMDAPSATLGLRCTSLPLTNRKQSTQRVNGIQAGYRRPLTGTFDGKDASTSQRPVQISYVPFSVTPRPPATSPECSNDIDPHSERQVGNSRNHLNCRSFDDDNLDNSDNCQIGSQGQCLESCKTCSHGCKATSNAYLSYQYEQQQKSKLGCLGQKTSATPISVERSITVADSSLLAKQIRTITVTKLAEEKALKHQKYLHARSPKTAKIQGPNNRPDGTKTRKDVTRNVFLLTHKGAKKFSREVHQQNGARQSKSPDLLPECMSPDGRKQSNNPSPGFSMLSSKSLIIKLPNAVDAVSTENVAAEGYKKVATSTCFIEKAKHTMKKIEKRDDPAHSHDLMRNGVKLSSHVQLQYSNLARNGFLAAGETNKELQQKQFKNKVNICLSDIVSSADSFRSTRNKATAFSQETSMMKAQSKNARLTRETQLDVSKKTQTVWPSKATMVCNSSGRASKKKQILKNKLIAKEHLYINELDDRLYRNQNISEFVMRQRNLKTMEMLNKTCVKSR